MTTIKLRRGTAAQWVSAATVLAAGEPGVETDTGVYKVGDGSTVWASLPVSNSGTYATLLSAAATYTWNTDGTLASVTQGGVTTTYTYNTDGTLATETRSGVTRTYTWNADGTLGSVA